MNCKPPWVSLGTLVITIAVGGAATAADDPTSVKAAPTQGTTALTACVGGMAAGFPCSGVDLAAHLPLSSIGGGSGNDVWGWTDAASGREFALMGRSSGTAFVEITDPENPVYLGDLPTETFDSTWRDIKTFADHAFIVSEASGHGMQVFDLTALLSVGSPPVVFSETALYGLFGSAHNVAINEDSGFAYAVGTSDCSGGLHMVNIQNPTAPSFAGCFSADGYTHDAQCVNYHGPDSDHAGEEICFNSNEDTLTIVDVTSKSAPSQISRTGYSSTGYTHQGWLTTDHAHYLMNDELDELNYGHATRTRVWDVSDLDNPQLIGFHDGSTTAIDHNLYTHRGYVFEANYRAGLQILDLADVANANLTEVGYFDIYPTDDAASFSGAWSTYPYFASGTVVVSGTGEGLFVLKPAVLQGEFTVSIDEPWLTVCDPGTDASTVALGTLDGYSGQVILNVDGLPDTASFSFTPPVVDLPTTTSSLLEITTSGTPAGIYPLTITGDDGAAIRSDSANLEVATGPPVAPSGIAPAHGSTTTTLSPTFVWTVSSDTVSSLLEIDDHPGFASIVYAVTVSGTSHTVTTPLDPDTTYHWRVTAANLCGATVSSTRSFTTIDTASLVFEDGFASGDTSRWSATIP